MAGDPSDRIRRAQARAERPPAPGPRPPALERLQPVPLDVRPDLLAGREPFGRIMSAVKALADNEVLVLRAPFEPRPLYEVLGRRGLAHWTERHAEDDWTVWFYRDAAAAPEPAPGPGGATGTVMLDVRGLEAPQPMMRVLESLDGLGPAQELLVLHDRRPIFLYPLLEDRGFTHETTEVEPGLVQIRVRRPR